MGGERQHTASHYGTAGRGRRDNEAHAENRHPSLTPGLIAHGAPLGTRAENTPMVTVCRHLQLMVVTTTDTQSARTA